MAPSRAVVPAALRCASRRSYAFRASSALAPSISRVPPLSSMLALRHPAASRTDHSVRQFSSPAAAVTPTLEPPDYLNEAELAIFRKLQQELSPSHLEVQDVSGGCGSMYALDITSDKFKGLSMVRQHKLVNQVLAEEIKGWHGVQLKTRSP